MQSNKPDGKRPVKQPARKPRTKEEAIQQLAERDPQRAAALLREILNQKK